MDVAAFVAESRAAQGLPPRVNDPKVLRHVARLLTVPDNENGPGSGRPGPSSIVTDRPSAKEKVNAKST